MCLPSQASACGVCAGEGSRRRSVIAGSFTLRTKIHSRRESRKKRCSGSRVGRIFAIRPSNELCKGLADCVWRNESISRGSVARRFFCSAEPLIAHARRVPRCPWATTEPAVAYHDEEWGVPLHNDRMLFEFLILEGAQAGLNWTTILKKRKNYRKAFDGFRAEKIACYGPREMKRLLSDAGIVRNRLKIAATISNAKAFLALLEEMESFDAYLWSFVGGKPIQNRWRRMADVPARTAESDAMSRDLLRRGFKFAGSTICYALMQATGMVNDHLVTCPRHAELGGAPRRK